ncbi:ABC transporter substrate-binding protein [Dactylosporangium siamense]|uniref:Peptide ABC transporter substrate-binding protein n=1 Tax=Dactylosporangium siamense TaxID=685454 RepID=A0A919UHL3_9ACTN|nr:ABC transporter substrate-binding protein [Dactylosporangium siamense]GIG52511.1 peptide ABC transporter substrate-binding protein [Dactylosporangium siamense]
MKSFPSRTRATVAVAVAALCLAGCGSGSGGSGDTKYATGATFTLAEAADPGSLDPQAGAGSSLIQMNALAYDSLVAVDAKGTILPQLASSWTVDGTTATFTIKSGITCADGAAFTAQTVVDNITYVENPESKSPLLGAFIPVGVTASASGSTVTLTLAKPSPFLLSSLANLPMVCDKGMKDRSTLKSGTDGTGPFTLSQASPGDQYTYTVRSGYTWGAGGASTAAAGTPAKIVVKIIANETTAANTLLAGQINAARIVGTDRTRLAGAGIASSSTPLLLGQQWYNQAAGHPTSDPQVRLALTEALDFGQLQKVLTANLGSAATQLAVLPPAGCQGDSVTGHVPATNVADAKAKLAAAGWTAGADGILAKDGKKLSLTMLYDSALGAGASAAAELLTSQWKAIGVEVTTKSQATAAMQGVMFGTGAWDVVWEALNVNTPDQLVAFLSGPAAPNGTNFAGINNATYTAAAAKAATKNGAAGCDDWLAAEAALFQAADVVPFANSQIPIFYKGATLSQTGTILPMSIKMLG